jgi:hypothetical protein
MCCPCLSSTLNEPCTKLKPVILAIQVKLHRTEQMRRKMGEIRIKSPKKLKKHNKNRSDWILYMFILLYYIIVLHPIHSTCRDFSSKLN